MVARHRTSILSAVAIFVVRLGLGWARASALDRTGGYLRHPHGGWLDRAAALWDMEHFCLPAAFHNWRPYLAPQGIAIWGAGSAESRTVKK